MSVHDCVCPGARWHVCAFELGPKHCVTRAAPYRVEVANVDDASHVRKAVYGAGRIGGEALGTVNTSSTPWQPQCCLIL